MGDPLYVDGLDFAIVLIVLLKVVVVFVFLLVAVMLMVWFERKVISDMQNRIGPNRAGPWGILQTLADGTKLFFKEDLLPDKADARIFRLAPFLAIMPGLRLLRHRPHRRRPSRIAGPPDDLAAAGRPALGGPLPARHVVDRGLRRDAGRVVVGLQVPAAGLGAGLGPDGVLRGGHGPGGGRRGALGRVPLHPRHRRRSGRAVPVEHLLPRRGALRGVPDRGHGRGQPARRSTWWRPSRSWWAGSTPSTRRSGSPCSSWPSS